MPPPRPVKNPGKLEQLSLLDLLRRPAAKPSPPLLPSASPPPPINQPHSPAKTAPSRPPASPAIPPIESSTEKAAAAVTETDLDPLPEPAQPAGLWPHQVRALQFLADKPAAMLAMEMGTGKTRVALEFLTARQCRRALILCPLSVVPHVWPAEARLRLGPQAQTRPLTARGNAAKLKQLQQANRDYPDPTPEAPQLIVLNYEAAWRGDLGQALLQAPWDLLILDESHRVKNPYGQAARFAARLGRRIPHKLALTGTPMPHSPLDLWAQYRVLNPELFPDTYREFENRYAVTIDPPPPRRGKQVIGYKNQEEFQDRFRALAYQASAQDVLDLPPARHTSRLVTLNPAARRAYQQMREELTAQLQGGAAASAANAAVMVTKLQQIAAGFLIAENGQVVDLDDAKEKALAEFLEDLPAPEPVVVFARFTRDLQRIAAAAQAAGRPGYELSGPKKQLAAWQKDPHGPVLAAQLQAGGLGIDLTKARHCVYYTLDYNLGNFRQSLARLRRPGQYQSVNYLYLLAADSIDEHILRALRNKENLVERVLRERRFPGSPAR